MQKKDIEFKCLVCNNEKFNFYKKISSFMKFVPEGLTRNNLVNVNLIKCSSCGLIHDLKTFEGFNYNKLYEKDTIYSKTNYSFENIENKYSKDIVSLISKFSNKNDNILEIGFCTPELLLKLRRIGYKVFGLELDPIAVKKAKKSNINAKKGTLKDTFLDTKFDLIYAIALFEHIENPKDFIGDLYKSLNKNGKIIIQLPNPISLNCLISNYFSKHSWDMFTEPGHVAHYTKKDLNKLFEMANFKLKYYGTSTIRVRGKIPFIPGRSLTIEKKLQNLTLNSKLFMFFYTYFLKIIDFFNLGDTQILIYEKK